MLKLRPYQQEAVDAVFQWFEGEGYNANPLVVLPTGTGKSLVLSEICKRSIAEYGDMKIVVVTHVMELIKQNYEELKGMWPNAPAGIYSAGVGRREHQYPITFCGIQSVHKKAVLFQKVDFVIIDEVHLLPRNADTMYRRFLEKLRIANPKLRVIGLTATPYRMDSGLLHRGDNALFDDICYEYSVIDAIKDGYLSNLITKKTELELDTTGVHTRGGEFIAAELQDAVDVDGINQRAVEEIIGWGQTRKSWLVFGSGVQHCKHLADLLVDEGITCKTIFGDTPKDERASIIDKFKKGEIRALCSMGVLTTGFNAPNVDMIAILRPTQSAGLFCFDTETEILTSHGWKFSEEVNVGDVALSINMENQKGIWSRIVEKIVRPMNNDESWVSYEAPRANFRVTNNHRMIISTPTFGGKFTDWKIETASKAASYKDGIRMMTAVSIEQPGVPLTDAELYLIGIIMTDGSASSHQVTIYQSERYPFVIKNIEAALSAANICYKKTRVKCSTQFQENFPRWRYSISCGEPKMNKGGKGIRYLYPYLDKDFSPLLMSLSKNQFKILLDAIWDGDGSKKQNVDYTPRSKEICTARKSMADRMQSLGVMNGYTVHLRKELGQRKNPIFILTFTDKNWRSVGGFGNRPKICTSSATQENVWCVETEAGTVVTRRRGKVTVMGNCQIVGRGMRLHPDKENCLILDFARNIQRHGPIDQIRGSTRDFRERTEESSGPLVKDCPECMSVLPLACTECPDCGYVFPREVKIVSRASDLPVLSVAAPVQRLEVDDVLYSVHNKPGKPPSLKVSYACGFVKYAEWICLEHAGYAQQKARAWWLRHAGTTPPATVKEALERKKELKKPDSIEVKKEGKYDRITRTFLPVPHMPQNAQRAAV